MRVHRALAAFAFATVATTASIIWLAAVQSPWATAQAAESDFSARNASPEQVASLEKALESAAYIGDVTCRGCHAPTNEHYLHTLHSKTFEYNPQDDAQARNCEACHGPGSAHLASPEDPAALIGYRYNSVAPVALKNDTCLQCHSGDERIHWFGSMHDNQELACSDCHDPMAAYSRNGLLRKAVTSEVCFDCHQQQRLEFRKRSHMPLPEGKISCIDCHNPHGSSTDPLLKADSANQVCYTCHAEKRGPFIWEHAPVRENCMNCHEPHGSNHEFLLVTARPFLCQQCHSGLRHPNDLQTRATLPGGQFPPDERLANRSCQNCHSQIHGSNHPAGVRMHR